MHMHVAWLYMLHAQFQRDAVDFRYREVNGGHFVRVDGEVKTWELTRCLREEFPDENERGAQQRQLRRDSAGAQDRAPLRAAFLSTAVAGRVQALVLNFEDALVARVRQRRGPAANSLGFPVLVSSLAPNAAVKVLKKRTRRRLQKEPTAFIIRVRAARPCPREVAGRLALRLPRVPAAADRAEDRGRRGDALRP